MKINARHRKAAELLAAGTSQRDVASAVGVVHQTIKNWLKVAQFAALVEQTGNEQVARFKGATRATLMQALGVLAAAMDGGEEAPSDKAVAAAGKVVSPAAMHRLAGYDAAEKVDVEHGGGVRIVAVDSMPLFLAGDDGTGSQ